MRCFLCSRFTQLLLSAPGVALALYALLLLPASTSSGARALYGSSDVSGASRVACAVGWLRVQRSHRRTRLRTQLRPGRSSLPRAWGYQAAGPASARTSRPPCAPLWTRRPQGAPEAPPLSSLLSEPPLGPSRH